MSGVERIAAERQRQIEKEGWTPEHDDQHTGGELALAAALYAAAQPLYARGKDHRGWDVFYDPWPWKKTVPHPRSESGFPGIEVNAWDKRDKHDRLRRLEIAGALIAAEIDRLERTDGARKMDEHKPDAPEARNG